MSMPPHTLVLVEDNDIDAELVRRLVGRLGLALRIVRARDGEDALELLCPESGETEPLRPAAIVLDINMPRMNGFELLGELERIGGLDSVPVFMLSTSGTLRDRASAERHGVHGYLVKPLRAPQLLEMFASIAGPGEEMSTA